MKIVYLDIETAPNIAYVWGMWDQNIGLDMLKAEWSILSFSYMWDTDKDKEVKYFDTRAKTDYEDDKDLLTELWKVLDEADVVVAHNGKRFDVPKINARFLAHDMGPPSPYRVVDTLKIAKSVFSFTSNKLEYLSDKLLPANKKKLKHKNFPGFMLWKECMAGNEKAWKEMEAYNRMDVIALKALYNKLISWSKQRPSQAPFIESKDRVCPCCGSKKVQSRGYYYTNVAKYQRFWCTKCSSWSRAKQMETPKEVRKNMLVNVTY